MSKISRQQTFAGLAIAVSAVLFVIAALALGVLFGRPSGGLSRSDAEKIAMTNAYSTTPALVTRARAARFSDFAHGDQTVAPGRWVWAVYFAGTFPPPSCGPAPMPGQTVHCPAPQHSELVLIDYFNGQFISASVPAPMF